MIPECLYSLAGLSCDVARKLYYILGSLLLCLAILAWVFVFRRLMNFCSRRFAHDCNCPEAPPLPSQLVPSGDFEGIPLDFLAAPQDDRSGDLVEDVDSAMTFALLHPAGVSRPLDPDAQDPIQVVVEGVVVASISPNVSNTTPGAA